MTPTVVDVDDLISEDQIIKWLLPLKAEVPDLLVTAYTIPNWMGDVRALSARYPWITFGIHGFEHTFCETRGWTDEQGAALLTTALGMGYAPLFKPPNWACDHDLEIACRASDVVLHHHVDYNPTELNLKAFPGSRRRRPEVSYVHTHILKSPVVDFIEDHPKFQPEWLKLQSNFSTPLECAREV